MVSRTLTLVPKFGHLSELSLWLRCSNAPGLPPCPPKLVLFSIVGGAWHEESGVLMCTSSAPAHGPANTARNRLHAKRFRSVQLLLPTRLSLA